MNLLLVASLASAGLVAGWGQRAVIVRYAAPAGEPPLRSCGACGERSGPSTLAVEATSALLLGALAARVHPGLVLAAACWLALCSVPLAFIDASVRRLPDVLTGAAFAGTALLLLAAAAAGGHWHVLAESVLGGVALAGFTCYSR